MKQVGILTPSETDDTEAFNAFRSELHKNYTEGVDITLHFRFSNGDNAQLRTLAAELLDIPVGVIVADGTNALKEVQLEADARNPPLDIKIIQAVGGEKPTAGNHTGFHLDVVNMCTKQIDRLHARGMTGVTILHDTTSEVRVGNAPGHDPYIDIRQYADNTFGAGNVSDVTARTPDELTHLNGQVVNSFMLIPSGMYFNNCPGITRFVDDAMDADANLLAIYPERVYRQAHKNANRNRAIVLGHHIPNTFTKAARYLDKILNGQWPQPTEADTDP